MLRKYGIGGQIRWTTWLSETPKIKKCGNLKSLVLKSWLEIHNIRKMRLGNPISGFKTLKFKLRNSRIMGLKLILKHPMIQIVYKGAAKRHQNQLIFTTVTLLHSM